MAIRGCTRCRLVTSCLIVGPVRSSVPLSRSVAHPRRRAGFLTVAVALAVYVVVVAASGSAGHTLARVGRDWPLLLLAAAAVLVTTFLTQRAPRRWRAMLTAALGGAAVGIALVSALAGGDHSLAELEEATGAPLVAVALPAPLAGLAVAVLLLAACVSAHGAGMPRRRFRPPRST